MVKKKILAISTALLALLLSLSILFPQQTLAADDNGWQIVSGQYEGNGVDNKTVKNADVRIQKNVKPTDVENEFQVYMAIDALCMETVTSTAITEILTPENLNTLYTGGSANGFPTCYSGQEHNGNGALASDLKGSAKNCEPGDITFKLVITYNENGHDYLIAQPVLSLGVPNSVLYLKVGDDFICLENIQDNGGRITIGGETPETDAAGNYIVPVHLTTMAYNALMKTLPIDEETTSSSSIIVGEDGSAGITDKMGSYIVFDGNASGNIKNAPAAHTEPGGTVNWELNPKPNTVKPAVPAGANKETTTEPASVVETADERITTNASTTTYTWTENGVQKVYYEVKKSVVTENLKNGNTEEVTSIISSWWAENLAEITYDAHLAVDKAGFVSGTDYPVNDTTTLHYGEGKSVNFINPEVEGTLYDFGFTKQDDSGTAMSGVSFTLAGPSGNPDVSSSTRTVTSGSDGKVSVTGLPWGTYTLTESVPAGYTASAIDPLQLSYTNWPDKVTHNAAANDVYKFPDGGKVVNMLNKVTVRKAVEVFGDLTKSEIEHTIYIALQDKNSGEYVKDSDGDIYYETITITAGVPSPATVTFEGIPSGEYDVMELASVDPPTPLNVNDVVHESDGTEIQIHGISAVEGDGTAGNDANLVDGVAEAEVSFTNTYAHADEPVKFTARKQWADYNGNEISAPPDAEVTFILYRTAEDTPDKLEEVTSVTLDGIAEELAEDTDTHIKMGELTAWEATFDNLPNQDESGYAYTYKVRETPVDGYAAYNGNTPMGEDDYLTRNGGAIINRKQSTDVTVKKVVSGHNPDDLAFSFTAEFGQTSAEFELKDGETKVIQDVPVGAELTVSETAADNFSTGVKCGDDSAEGTEYTYTVAAPADEIVFTNTREVGSLAVSKTVSSDLTSDQSIPFTFTISLDDDTITGTFGDATFENGEATIELTHGQTKNITGLPAGVGYTVTETPVEGLTADKTKAAGTISTTASTAGFTNTREVGDLTVSKTMESPLEEDADAEFDFVIFLTGNGSNLSGTYECEGAVNSITVSRGSASLMLKGGDTVTIKGLPTDIGYEVHEEECPDYVQAPLNDDGYPILTGKITTDGATAAFTNTRKLTDVSVEKVWDGPESTAEISLIATPKGESGKVVGTIDLPKDGNNTFTWTDLPQTKDGVDIVYSVREAEIAHYKSSGPIGEGTEDSPFKFTNKYKASGTATLEVTKALAGDEAKWPEGQSLTFTLKGEGNAKMPAATAVNINKAGEVSFGSIAFDETDIGKEYTYTISEDGFGAGWTGSGDVTAKIKVNDKGGCQLEPVVTYSPENATITNTYSVEPVEVALEAAKSLSGRKLKEGEFSFTLSGSGVKETKKNDADGAVKFSAITYTKPGKYTYTIKEDSGDVSRVTYDTHEFAVTVDVADNGKGKLEAAVTYDGETSIPVFENTYDPDPAEANISVNKELTGRDLKAGEFEFTLDLTRFVPADETKADEDASEEPEAEAPASDTPPAEKAPAAEEPASEDVPVEGTAYVTGKAVSLMPASFTAVIGEVDEAPEDDESVEAVSEQAEEAEATAEPAADAVDDASQLNGAEPISLTAKNDAAGLVNFDRIEFKKAGTYIFEIKEKKGGTGGITYDGKTVTVTVDVTYDDAEGEFSAKVKYPESKTFSNKYEPASASVSLEAKKAMNGRALNAEEFSFTLSGSGVSETVKNAADGKVAFSPITYDKEGTYTYTIKEDSGSVDKVKYDTHEIKVTVDVKDDKEGKLIADVSYEGAKTFVNAYRLVTIDPPVRKSIEGAPEELETYTFKMEAGRDSFPMPAAAGGASSMTVDIEGAGEMEFGEIAFTEPGTYWYTVSEVAGDNPDCEYDSSVYLVTAVVTEDPDTHMLSVKTAYERNGQQVQTAAFEFTNAYPDKPEEPDEPDKPDTDDSNDLAGMLGLMGTSAAGLIGLFAYRRRRNHL